MTQEQIEELTNRVNDMQMQINSLKAEFERLNNVMNVIHQRITKLQEIKKNDKNK